MKKLILFSILLILFAILYVNVNAEVDEIVIPEAANREISATVVLKRLLQGLE